MTKKKLFIIVIVLCLLSGIAHASIPPHVPGELILKLKPDRSFDPNGGWLLSAVFKSGIQRQLESLGAKEISYLNRRARQSGFLQSVPKVNTFPTRQRRAPEGVSAPDLDREYLLRFDESADLESLMEQIRQNSDVESVFPNVILKILMVPDDPIYSAANNIISGEYDQWGMYAINAAGAWDYSISFNYGVTIAVIDSGLDREHEDISSVVWTNPGEISGNGIDDDGNGYVDDYYGWDFYNDDNDPTDENGHGTHVASCVGGAVNNSTGMAGTARNVKIMGIRVTSASGNAFTSDLLNAIDYAVNNGADVINMSLGGVYDANDYYDTEIQNAIANGVLVVAAAGNESTDNIVGYMLPVENDIGIDAVIGVSAFQSDGNYTSFTNYGSYVDVSAPGLYILGAKSTTVNATFPYYSYSPDSKYVYTSGTSQATPIVAGLVAEMIQVNPLLGISAIKQRLYAAGTDAGAVGRDDYYGYGRIAALTSVAACDPITPSFIDYQTVTYSNSGVAVVLTACVTDNWDCNQLSGLIPSVSIYWLEMDNLTPSGSYQAVLMSRSGSLFSGTIPAPSALATNIRYYYSAVDRNPSNTVTCPSDAPASYINILLEDITGPVIDFTQNDGEEYSMVNTLNLQLQDNNVVDYATLEIGIYDVNGQVGSSMNATSAFITYNSTTLYIGIPNLSLSDATEYRFQVNARDVSNNASSATVSLNMTSLTETSTAFTLMGPQGSGSRPVNYPNPFNPDSQTTAFCYQLSAAADVTIRVYTLGGRLVRQYIEAQARGYRDETSWDGRDENGGLLPNGVYFYTIVARAGDGTRGMANGKIVILR